MSESTQTESVMLHAEAQSAFVAWADALPLVEPAPALRARVLERIRSAGQTLAAGLRTVRADDGWIPFAPGIRFKMLHRDPVTRTNTLLADLDPGVSMPAHGHAGTEECFVIRGEIRLGDVIVGAGDFHLAGTGAEHGELSTAAGALLYLRVAWGEHIPEAG